LFIYFICGACLGQIIPKGLHVRLNLETGEKEAKLMDDEGVPRSRESAGNIFILIIPIDYPRT